MNKFRPYVLPIAIGLGLLFHDACSLMAGAVPYLIFTILLFTFCSVDLRRLRPSMMDVWLMVFQLGVSAICYIALRLLTGNKLLAEGVMIGVLCPVASSAATVACLLGANRERVTSYTIVGNLMVAIAAPLAFSIIGHNPELGFWASLWSVGSRVASTLALPYLIALALQILWPAASAALARRNIVCFYLWAVALFLTLGQTIDYIFLHGEGQWHLIGWFALLAAAVCALQFGVGRAIGRRYGDRIGGGQLLGQKNSGFGIWMANTFLTPLSAVFLAFYSIYQNLFNAWQLARTKSTTATPLK